MVAVHCENMSILGRFFVLSYLIFPPKIEKGKFLNERKFLLAQLKHLVDAVVLVIENSEEVAFCNF